MLFSLVTFLADAIKKHLAKKKFEALDNYPELGNHHSIMAKCLTHEVCVSILSLNNTNQITEGGSLKEPSTTLSGRISNSDWFVNRN